MPNEKGGTGVDHTHISRFERGKSSVSNQFYFNAIKMLAYLLTHKDEV